MTLYRKKSHSATRAGTPSSEVPDDAMPPLVDALDVLVNFDRMYPGVIHIAEGAYRAAERRYRLLGLLMTVAGVTIVLACSGIYGSTLFGYFPISVFSLVLVLCAADALRHKAMNDAFRKVFDEAGISRDDFERLVDTAVLVDSGCAAFRARRPRAASSGGCGGGGGGGGGGCAGGCGGG